MNNVDKYILKAEQFFLFLYVALLPTGFSVGFSKAKLGNLILILWSAAILLAWLRGLAKPRLHWMLFLFSFLFFLTLFGFFNSSELSSASRTLELRSGIIVLPLLICISPALKVFANFDRLTNLYILSTMTLCLYCLLGALLSYKQTGSAEVFLYHSLSGQVSMHAVYLSVFLIISIIFIVYKFLFGKSSRWKEHPIISLGAIFLLAMSITLLSSRIAIAFMTLLLMGSIMVVIYRKWGLIVSMVGALGVAILLIGIVFSIPSNRDRFKEIISYGDEYGISGKWGDAQFRYLIWTCAWEVTVKGSIWGVGTGDAQRALSDCYVKNDYKTLAYLASEGETFNAHNQFLQVGVEFGWVGLVVMVASIAIICGYSVRDGNILMLSFMALAMCFFTTESVLERYNGVSFFYFFGPFLFYFHPKLNDNKSA